MEELEKEYLDEDKKEEQPKDAENLEDNENEETKRDEFDDLLDSALDGDGELTASRLRDLRANHDALRQRVFGLENDLKDRDTKISEMKKEFTRKFLSTPVVDTEDPYEEMEPEKDYFSDLANQYKGE